MEEIARIMANAPEGLTLLSSNEHQEAKADAINTAPGTLGWIDCPICHNKGYVAQVRDGRIVCVECECQVRRTNTRLVKQSGLESVLRRYTFEEYKDTTPWQKQVKKRAESFTEASAGWFYISGTPGSGKTHICSAICGEMLKKNISVRYFRWRADAPALKASVNDRTAYSELIRPFLKTRCLYIDDFFKGSITDADKNLAFELLDARYSDPRLITIISSELSVDAIIDIDEALGSRIYERARGYTLNISGPDKNYRLRKGE